MIRGFTLIELLVVIAIIGLLASVTLASLEGARLKAQDARRASDMAQIMRALHLYYDDHGCLPRTISGNACDPGQTDSNNGGWDISTAGTFMQFLESGGYMPNVPVDPLNDGDPTNANSRHSYRYYCYFPGQSGLTNGGVHLGYWESNGAYVRYASPGTGWVNDDFLCR